MQEFFLALHTLEIFVDSFIFPLLSVIIFGLISLYLIGSDETIAAQYILLGMILWQVIWVISYSVATGSMWNIWSKNLSNMFVSPLTVSEYMSAHFISGCAKAVLLLVIANAVSMVMFHFSVLSIGVPVLVLTFIVFAAFAFAVSIAVLGLIFRYGTRIAALSWSLITVFQPLAATFYPLADMPHLLQYVALLLPPTYAFEAARYSLVQGEIAWSMLGMGFALDAVYGVACVLLFRQLFRNSRDTGQFARNES
ncbi:ABC transporter permease [Candidatus Kaiserbacteria bacterium]|nr:ABC transporter permease [Candidatus Kaiserbacteria bacterium]